MMILSSLNNYIRIVVVAVNLCVFFTPNVLTANGHMPEEPPTSITKNECRILVKFHPNTEEKRIAAIHAAIGGHFLRTIQSIGVEIVQCDQSTPINTTLRYYRAQPEVVYAEADQKVFINTPKKNQVK